MPDAVPDLLTDLWVWYPLDDAADETMTDIGPHGYDMTVHTDGGYPLRTTKDGKACRQFTRAGTSGSIATPTNYGVVNLSGAEIAPMVQTEQTVALWYYAEPLSGASTGIGTAVALIGDGATVDGAQHYAYALAVQHSHTTGIVRSFATTPASTQIYTPAAAYNQGAWHQVVFVTRDNVAGTSSYIDYYLDGAFIATSTSVTASRVRQNQPPNGANLFISAQITPSDTVNPNGQMFGYLRDIRIYHRALRAVDVLELYRQTR